MSPPIAVKWTLKNTYRAKLSLDDLFDPTTNHTPVHSEIFAKLMSCAPVDDPIHRQGITEPIILEIRLPGSKEYVTLSKEHRTSAELAGRARIRVASSCVPRSTSEIPGVSKPTTTNMAAQNDRVQDTSACLAEFLQAGSSSVGLDQAVKGEPIELDQRASTQLPSSKLEKFFADMTNWHEDKSEASKDTKGPSSSPEYTTRADVAAMIEARVLELQNAVQSTKDRLTTGFQSRPERTAFMTRASVSKKGYKHNACCDFCDKDICGTRWKCLECPDFDTCNDCSSLIKESHATHKFVKVVDNSILRASNTERKSFHSGVRCDGPACVGSRSTIYGDRYKCSICPDYDLCAGCEVHPLNTHNKSHPMIKLKEPVKNISIDVRHDAAEARGRSVADVSLGLPRWISSKPPVYQPAVGREEHQKTHHTASREGPEKQAAATTLVHASICCDSCNAVIRGDRYMCATCWDFDYCESCYSHASHPSDHVFVRYQYVVDNLLESRVHIPAVEEQQTSTSDRSFYCNVCYDSPSSGKRYNCLICPDWDACEKCKDAHTETLHPLSIIPKFQSIGVSNGSSSAAKSRNPEDEISAKAEATSPPVAKTTPASAESFVPKDLPASDILNDLLSKFSKKTQMKATVEDEEELSCAFLEDLSIPDGSVMETGSQFVKQWLLMNNGNVAWPAGVSAVFTGGFDLSPANPSAAPIQTSMQSPTLPGQSVVVSVFLQAPAHIKNNVTSNFRLMTTDGKRFGKPFWVDIDVVAPTVIDRVSVESLLSPVLANDASHSSVQVEDVAEASLKDSVSESVMIFPSASTELPKTTGSASGDSASAAGSQHQEVWHSEDEVTLSDDEEYDLLDNESVSDA